MTDGLNRSPLWTQFMLWVMLVMLMGTLMAFILMGRAYIASAQSRARTIANLVEDVGTWASKYQGVWVLSDTADASQADDFLETVQVEARPASPFDGSFHRKNPALVQRELSDVTMAVPGRSARFRMTSDKFMNPNNAPTRFELAAIGQIRESGGTEAVEIKGNRLLYARRLTVETGCMSCHDSPETAPAAVRARYPDSDRGYGYKLGDVAGVISVSVPIVERGNAFIDSLGPAAWLSIGGFIASLGGLLWFVRRAVIAPVQRLSAFASQASESDVEDIKGRNLRFTEAEETSRNEVHRLGVAVKRLLRSLKVQRRY